MPFKTIEEAEKHYNEAIKRAESKPQAVLELRAEKATVVADLKLQAIAARERALWIREALRDFPLAREFEKEIVGETEDAVRASAQTMHQRLDKIFESYQKERRITELVKAQLEKPEPNGGQPAEPKDGPDAGAAP